MEEISSGVDRYQKEEKRKCTQCKKEFPIDQFRSERKNRTNQCLKCRKRARELSLKCRKSRIELYQKIRTQHFTTGCTICGEKKENVLEFDHLDPKTKLFNISNWTHFHKFNEDNLCTEIDKTQILCRFHHQILSAEQREKDKLERRNHADIKMPFCKRNAIARNKTFVNEQKMKIGECSICERQINDSKELPGFGFFHIEGSEKRCDVSTMIQKRCSISILKLEIEKCILVCANCHSTKISELVKKRKSENWYLPPKKKYKQMVTPVLSKEQREEIRKRYHSKEKNQYELAEEYGVSQTHISDIILFSLKYMKDDNQ